MHVQSGDHADPLMAQDGLQALWPDLNQPSFHPLKFLTSSSKPRDPVGSLRPFPQALTVPAGPRCKLEGKEAIGRGSRHPCERWQAGRWVPERAPALNPQPCHVPPRWHGHPPQPLSALVPLFTKCGCLKWGSNEWGQGEHSDQKEAQSNPTHGQGQIWLKGKHALKS